MVHGSSVFTRGETQSLTTLTLGGKMDEQLIDGVTFHGTEKFLLHYNFPPFSTGEAKPLRGTSRREIGHGNLALRALKPVLPEDNAYTIRLVSDKILSGILGERWMEQKKKADAEARIRTIEESLSTIS